MTDAKYDDTKMINIVGHIYILISTSIIAHIKFKHTFLTSMHGRFPVVHVTGFTTC